MKTNHHIVPESRGGNDSERNIVRIPDNKHKALHCCHGNAMPHEQFEDLLWLNSQVLRAEFADKVAKLLSHDTDFIYEGGVFRRK